jgi:opacity protein-like surface antigen
MSIRKLVVAASLSLMATIASAADVTGTWVMTVDTGQGTGNPTFVLKQEGEKVTGSYKGQLGEAPVEGTIKGNDLALSYKISAQGVDLEVKYTGTVDGKNVAGKVSLGDLGEGTFKGTKQ